ncbi:MAG: WD40/YVTN/BNR-like repeat-containing protein [Flavobacteriales bacterium]
MTRPTPLSFSFLFPFLFSFLFFASAGAQTSGTERLTSFNKRSEQSSLFTGIPFRNIGPTVMSGRVVDIQINPNDPTNFYVAYASGGLWVTFNNGTSFEPIMDHLAAMTIGAIAIDWKNNTIWVGTGENNSSRSSYSGIGMYKSLDMGKTWQYSGLPESHHIGKIVLHPFDSNKIWVGVLGHLYTDNAERGVYFSNDGGKNWVHQLKAPNTQTGCIDIEINSSNPDELFAALWQRDRKAWNFSEAGEGSGIYHSLDGGKTWNNISKYHDFPADKNTGRIGIALHIKGKEKFLYAVLDNQNLRPEEKDKPSDRSVYKKTDFQKMSKEEFAKIDTAEFRKFLADYGFPREYNVDTLQQMISSGKITPTAIYDFVFDANEDLFNTPVIGTEVYAFNFTTQRWSKTHDGFLDDITYSYGYYFGVIEVDPVDPKRLYIAGVPLCTSADGGKTWSGINPGNVHVDHHVVRINPNNTKQIWNGSDGGVQISYDQGKTFVNCNSPAVGQFYTVQVDNNTPYNVYGGLQDNGVWVGSSQNVPNRNWTYEGRYPFDFLMGGDGMQVQVDARNSDIVYTGYQFGNYYKLNRASKEETYLHPAHTLGEKPLRYNWQTPILLSTFNQDIFYMCSNKVHRSMDAGEHFTTISGDLTRGGKEGDVPFGTITTITESPIQFGYLATGADDGSVHITKDGGITWTDISKGLPAKYVSRIIFSHHHKDRIYISLNGYREDDMKPYLFVSNDAGITWKNIALSLPLEPINVIREDRTNEQILYLGTDHGLYVSIDGGMQFHLLGDLPHAPVHDLVIQEDAKELVVATHGRSIYIGSVVDIRTIAANPKSPVVMHLPETLNYLDPGSKTPQWFESPKSTIDIRYLSEKDITLELYTNDSILIYSTTLKGGKTFQTFSFDRRISSTNVSSWIDQKKGWKKSADGNIYLPAGEYYWKCPTLGTRSVKVE